MKSKIRLAVADDHRMFRETLCEKLNEEKNISVIGSFGNGIDLYNFLEDRAVDVVLLDIDMPGMDGFEVLTKLLQRDSSTKVIIISFHVDGFYINKLMTCGALAYITKVNGYDEILDAVYSVYENGLYINQEVKDALVKSYLQKNKTDQSIKKLNFSDREIEIIRLICEDKTAKEIGAKLFIEPKTVEGHKSRIKDKLGVKSSIGIVVFAIVSGIYLPQPTVLNK